MCSRSAIVTRIVLGGRKLSNAEIICSPRMYTRWRYNTKLSPDAIQDDTDGKPAKYVDAHPWKIRAISDRSSRGVFDIIHSSLVYDMVSTPDAQFSNDDVSLSEHLNIKLKQIEDIKIAYTLPYAKLASMLPEQQALSIAKIRNRDDLVAFCAYQGDHKLALIAIKEILRKEGKPARKFPIMCLMSAHARAGDLPGAKALFEDLPNLGLQKDSEFYSILIEAYTTANDVEGAFLVLEELGDQGIVIQRSIYDDLIEACVRFGDLDRVWHLFEFMRVKLFHPGIRTYTTMIEACGKSKSVEKAISLFDELSSKNFVKNVEVYNALLLAYCSRRDYCDRAFDILNSMVASGVSPNNRTYELLISSAASRGNLNDVNIMLADFYEKIRDRKYDGLYFETPKIICNIVDANVNRAKASRRQLGYSQQGCTNNPSIAAFLGRNLEYLADPDTKIETGEPADGNAQLVAVDSAETSNCDSGYSELVGLVSQAINSESNQGGGGTTAEDTGSIKQAADSLQRKIYNAEIREPISLPVLVGNVMYIWKYLKNFRPGLITSQVLDSYLKLLAVCGTQSGDDDVVVNFFRSLYPKFNAAHTPDTYSFMLHWVGAREERSKNFAREILDSYLEFDRNMEVVSFGLPSKNLTPLDRATRELERCRQGRSKYYTKNNFVLMANALAVADDIEGSLAVLEEAENYRYSGYIPKIHQVDVLKVFWGCYKFVYSNDFSFLARFYTLVKPSEMKLFRLPFADTSDPSEEVSMPFQLAPRLNSDFPTVSIESEPNVHMYPFYPSLPKGKRSSRY